MHCGIEFEYLIIDTAGPRAGRIRNFTNLAFKEISALLADKPGCDDPALATGDLGIKRGYWYLEGDERFHDDGRFRTLEVKGVEIRTPPAESVAEAVYQLLDIEGQLATVLAREHLGLAIAGFNPVHASYAFDPPLNAWEASLRSRQRAYDGSPITNLSYGPDINLSLPEWSAAQSLDAARKLNFYAPWIVPFSFSSPFFAGKIWSGYSKRTYERAPLRPAVKLFLGEEDLATTGSASLLTHPARVPREAGRIEFKAFDAMPSLDILLACSHLLEGICLADDLPGRSEEVDVERYQGAARDGFADDDIRSQAGAILASAGEALRRAGAAAAARSLAPLENLLAARHTPAHGLLAAYRHSGLMFKPGGFG